ncbi:MULTISPECIES: alpha-amylase family glycosyl hydrolase [unclassified Luteococcus]|uniref:alpha-amylase family glycosyl hydrolase n=1 Tax=unclassified Luteococcus TaxID=2639923 RepID=UPI00313CF3EB
MSPTLDDVDWWRDAVMYQVYLRSFADGNGDGIGDLSGLMQRLDHIASLGVQGIWLTPFQPSPQVDFGYDVSDYCGVDPLFGTLHDFDRMMARAHELGLRVLVDVVPNHCSSQHPTFQAALAAGPGSPERGMFHFHRSEDDAPPNNWQSVFGGQAWSRACPEDPEDQDWYLHLFSPQQPDWNWDNPAVHEMFDGVLRFWFEHGADGVRIDVAHALLKAPGLPDLDEVTNVVDGLRANRLASDQEGVHEIYRGWRRLADSYEPPRILVGEVNLPAERAARYARADELHQTFAFEFIALGWDPDAWVRVGSALEEARLAHGPTPTWALENHDIVRSTTRFGGGELGARRARAALLAILGLPGGAYIYQGQELGLPEVDVPVHQRVDPMWQRGGVTRDGTRVPLPWIMGPAGGHGFSSRTDATPWLPQPEGWGKRSVEAVGGAPGSMVALVREAIALRHALADRGVFAWADPVLWERTAAGGIMVRRGDRIRVVVAMGGPEPLPAGEVLVSSQPVVDGILPADGCAWVRI